MDLSFTRRDRHIDAARSLVCVAMLIATSVTPATLWAGTTCVTPAGNMPCGKGPARKPASLPAPGAASSRAAAARQRQQQVSAQRQQQVNAQRQALLKQRQDQLGKQRAEMRSGLKKKNDKS